MSCSACSSRVEKAVLSLSGVTSCSVSLLTNSMGVEGNVSDVDIIKAVEDVGYNATVKDITDSAVHEQDLLEDRETPILKKRLIWSVGFLIVLMYFSMGYTMFNFPVPDFFKNNYICY
jgi:Cu2+-exporting ATPase